MKAATLALIPWPRKIKLADGWVRLGGAGFAPGSPLELRSGAAASDSQTLGIELVNRELARHGPDARSSADAPDRTRAGVPSVDPVIVLAPERFDLPEDDEAYGLRVSERGIEIAGRSERAIFHALQTLRQLARQFGRTLPQLEIIDWPAFRHRGYMLDVSRGKVPRLETLFELVDTLALVKYNQLQLYIEHTFAFERHPEISEGHSPLTAEDIRALDDYCRRRHIELVPNLQSFGHATHILKHERYRHLAESDFRGGWTLSPAEPGTYELLADFYEEFLPNFSNSDLFNVNCDEPWDLGEGKSAAIAKRDGKGKLYLSHLLRVRELAARHGRRTMLWGDVVQTYPELARELPDDVILLNWEYDAADEKSYRKRIEPARASGREHWVCPGTSAWNSLFFRKANAERNLLDFARAGVDAGAAGYLVTDWGDNGHFNSLAASLWPLAFGAQCAWSAKSGGEGSGADAADDETRGATTATTFDRAFCSTILQTERDQIVETLGLLGGIVDEFGIHIPNNSPERWMLTWPTGVERPDRMLLGDLAAYDRITKRAVETALAGCASAIELLEISENLADPDWQSEWRLAAALAAHACRRFLYHNFGSGDPRSLESEMKTLRTAFEKSWTLRNRPGELQRNLAELDHAAACYAEDPRCKIMFGSK